MQLSACDLRNQKGSCYLCPVQYFYLAVDLEALLFVSYKARHTEALLTTAICLGIRAGLRLLMRMEICLLVYLQSSVP